MMKYSNYSKKELLEVIECLEHNYNVQKERANNQFEMLKTLQEKLDIAVKALECYGDKFLWCDSKVKLGIDGFGVKTQEVLLPKSCYHDYGFKEAQEALAKIKEIK